MAALVVRRFEVHGPSADVLGDLEAAVEHAVDGNTPGDVARAIERVERPPLLDVRLQGDAVAISAAMHRVAMVRGGRILHDVVRVRPGKRKEPVYPDPRVSAIIGTDLVDPAPGSAPVKVAIVDSGLMFTHRAFAGHLWEDGGAIPGKQFIEGKRDDDITDQDGHGTLLAGTVLTAALDAPVKLMAAKFFDAENPPRPRNAAAALRFATEMRAQIIVIAWDVGIGSKELEHAFHAACKSALVVIAAGNYGADNDWYDDQTWARAPVRYTKDSPDHTITVMATDDGAKAWFSNYGRRSVDLGAPGRDITSTRHHLSKATALTPQAYGTHGGTSAAAAIVGGAAALLMSRYPGLGLAAIKRCLLRSVDVLPDLKCVSGGRLNVAAALACAAAAACAPAAAKG